MLHSINTRLTIIVCLACCFLLQSFPTQARASGPETLVIGRTTSDPKKHYPKLQALALYLEPLLAVHGIRRIVPVFARTTEEMSQLLSQGKVHVISETLFSAHVYIKDGSARTILREWKQGVPEYQAVFFAHKTSNLRDIDDLAGKVIAFEDPESTSAYRVPRTLLENRGFSLFETAWPGQNPAPVPENKIGFIFAQAEANIARFVADGRVHAGAFSNLDWADPEVVSPTIQENLVLLHRSSPIPRSLMLVSTTLDHEIVEVLRTILLEASTQPSGVYALKEYNKTTQYDLADDTTVFQYLDKLMNQR